MPEKEKHSKGLEKLLNNDLKDFLQKLFEDNQVDPYIKTQVASYSEIARAQLQNALNVLKANNI